MSIALVQQVAVKLTVGGSANKTVTISAPAAGSGLRLLVRANINTVSISSVTGGGVTWTQLANVSSSNNSSQLWLFGGDNSSGSGTTITIAVSDTYGNFEANVSEWSGLDTTPVTDPAPSTNTGTSSTLTTSTVTPTAGKEVLLLAIGSIGINTLADNTPDGGFTALSKSGTATRNAFGYQIVGSASGSYSTHWDSPVSYAPWATIIAGWDAAAGGGGPTVQPRSAIAARQAVNRASTY